MKQQFECQACGKLFWCPMRKAWAIWLCNIHKFKSESKEDVEVHDRIRLITTVFSFHEANDYVIKDMEPDQCKEFEKLVLNKEKYCPKCKHIAKVYHDRLQARIKKDAKQRAIASGDKTGKISVIPEQDMKGWTKFMVDKKVETDQKAAEQVRLEEERKQELKRSRVFIHNEPEKTEPKEEPKDVSKPQ